MVEINKKIILVLLSILLCVSLISAEGSVIDTLEQGETKAYTVNGRTYEITINFIGTVGGTSKAKMTINDAVTPAMAEGDIYQIDEFSTFRLISINEPNCGEVTCDSLTFELKTIHCGDETCNPDENCASCPADCGCSSNYECKINTCVRKVICGDDICDDNEFCEKDECCDGKNVNLDRDENNCGNCSNECSDYEKCKSGECKTYCGNYICDRDETCDSCDDCRCESGYECEDAECIKLDECSKDSDCDDGKACTIDVCLSKISRECSYIINEGCESKDGCVPKGTFGLKNNKLVYCDGSNWKFKKETGDSCSSDYECRINSCNKGICREQTHTQTIRTHSKNVFSRFFGWFSGLF